MAIYYITKYATTRGMFAQDMEPAKHDSRYVKNAHFFCKEGRDAFLREGDAIKDCQKRVDRKITAIKRQLSKMESEMSRLRGEEERLKARKP